MQPPSHICTTDTAQPVQTPVAWMPGCWLGPTQAGSSASQRSTSLGSYFVGYEAKDNPAVSRSLVEEIARCLARNFTANCEGMERCDAAIHHRPHTQVTA
ncbi:hypothetical protein Bbelb_209660 [Branchiostoma belcheri]|nr:hypothetical protein Bbelb_209660 [Branchiostoma belcheri]